MSMEDKTLPILKNGRWENPWDYQHFGWIEGAMYQFLEKKHYPDDNFSEEFPQESPNEDSMVSNTSEYMNVTWIRHATVLVCINGINILFDPMFSTYGSPVYGFGPRAFRQPPCRIRDLPEISAVFISHNHYDHLDRWSIKEISERWQACQFFVPNGMRDWFGGLGLFTRTHEFTWWEKLDFTPFNLNRSVEVTFVPAMHWSGRTLFNRNCSLWGGWVVREIEERSEKRGKSVYFTGDTAFCPVFEEIGKHFGNLTVALIPIGSSEPRDFMKHHHCTPCEAAQIFLDCRAQNAIGVHFACFPTAQEPLKPVKDLETALSEYDIDADRFIVVNEGETKIF